MERTGWEGRDRGRAAVIAAAALAVTVAVPTGTAAQVAWDAPFLVHPHAPAGWSVFLAEPYPGDDIAVTATWRTAPVPVGFGGRVGLGEAADGDLAVYAGLDASGSLIRHSAEIPLDLIWVAGGGLSFSGDVLVSFPLGLVAGWDLRSDDVTFRPYVGPRVVLDGWLGGRDRGEGDDLQLEATVDLGVDVAFPRGWIVRFGASVADREALAIGLAFPAPGRR